MKKENFELFKERVELIFKGLVKWGINFKIIDEPEEDQPAYYIELTDKNLKRWKLGIWAVGSWSDYYAVEDEDEIVVFMIHDWFFDKWRPSNANVSWSFLPNSTYFGEFLYDLNEMKKNPINSFGNIFLTNQPQNKWPFLYFKEWYFNVISTPFKYKLKMVWSPWVLYLTLRFFSLFDRRVKRVEVFREKSRDYNYYTFSFLANLMCSESDESFYKFYKLYSYFPQWLKWKCKYKLFDATYNVSDYDWNMNENQIRTRMFKGVIAEKPNKNETDN